MARWSKKSLNVDPKVKREVVGYLNIAYVRFIESIQKIIIANVRGRESKINSYSILRAKRLERIVDRFLQENVRWNKRVWHKIR